MSLKETEQLTSRETPDAMEKRLFKAKLAAMEKAMKGEKVRYKSKRDPERFLEFLEYRLTIWERLKDEKFYAKRMYEKTKEVIEGLSWDLSSDQQCNTHLQNPILLISLPQIWPFAQYCSRRVVPSLEVLW